MGEVLNRVKVFFVALVVALVAATVGYMAGQSETSGDLGFDRSISAEFLNHKGTSSGKSCEPHGRYGNVKPPRASHCDNN